MKGLSSSGKALLKLVVIYLGVIAAVFAAGAFLFLSGVSLGSRSSYAQDMNDPSSGASYRYLKADVPVKNHIEDLGPSRYQGQRDLRLSRVISSKQGLPLDAEILGVRHGRTQQDAHMIFARGMSSTLEVSAPIGALIMCAVHVTDPTSSSASAFTAQTSWFMVGAQ